MASETIGSGGGGGGGGRGGVNFTCCLHNELHCNNYCSIIDIVHHFVFTNRRRKIHFCCP